MNDLQAYRDIFSRLTPWSGHVPQGFLVDFLGVHTRAKYRASASYPGLGQAGHLQTSFPTLGRGENGEGWFEAVNWVVAAREARERFVMISLGAHYGAQLVGAHRMVQLLNPMRCTLVAVEGEPENYSWISEHMADNGIDPNHHWLLPLVVNDTHSPVLFPVGAAGVGSNNCFSTNNSESRAILAELIVRDIDPAAALRRLLVENKTGLQQPVHPGLPYITEIKALSAITLADLLAPFDMVDFIEADIQQSEIVVFPPFIDLLAEKVKRIHIGTHGKDVHRSLLDLFFQRGWEIVFAFEPNSRHSSELGDFELNDGILTVRNPAFQ